MALCLNLVRSGLLFAALYLLSCQCCVYSLNIISPSSTCLMRISDWLMIILRKAITRQKFLKLQWYHHLIFDTGYIQTIYPYLSMHGSIYSPRYITFVCQCVCVEREREREEIIKHSKRTRITKIGGVKKSCMYIIVKSVDGSNINYIFSFIRVLHKGQTPSLQH